MLNVVLAIGTQAALGRIGIRALRVFSGAMAR